MSSSFESIHDWIAEEAAACLLCMRVLYACFVCMCVRAYKYVAFRYSCICTKQIWTRRNINILPIFLLRNSCDITSASWLFWTGPTDWLHSATPRRASHRWNMQVQQRVFTCMRAQAASTPSYDSILLWLLTFFSWPPQNTIKIRCLDNKIVGSSALQLLKLNTIFNFAFTKEASIRTLNRVH